MANSAAIRGRITGVEELIKTLNVVKNGARNKLLRRATTKASRYILKLGKAKCPIDTSPHLTVRGLMKKSMGMKVRTTKRGSIIGVIGPRRGFKTQVGVTRDGKPKYQDPAKIAHLVEYGHGGPAPAPPHPFMRIVWGEGRQPAFRIYADELIVGVPELVRTTFTG